MKELYKGFDIVSACALVSGELQTEYKVTRQSDGLVLREGSVRGKKAYMEMRTIMRKTVDNFILTKGWSEQMEDEIEDTPEENELPYRDMQIYIVGHELPFEICARYCRELESNHWHYYEQEDGELIHFRKEHIVGVKGGTKEDVLKSRAKKHERNS